jgi:hypothetical protein
MRTMPRMLLVSGLYGRWPTRNWYTVMPSEYMSATDECLWPAMNTSGAMYGRVPDVELHMPSTNSCEMPRSVTLSCPRESSSRFSGLMSRCTTPEPCMYSSATTSDAA